MKENIKQEWLAALRSGTYKQGTGRLRPTEDTYCAVGVLGDIACKHYVAEWNKPTEYWRLEGYVGELPVCVQNWAGLEEGIPEIKGESLDYYNDQEGLSLKRIADLIEQYL